MQERQLPPESDTFTPFHARRRPPQGLERPWVEPLNQTGPARETVNFGAGPSEELEI